MKFSRTHFIVLLVALSLRASWALLVPVHPISDSHAYDVFAQNLASGNGYGWVAGAPTAFWPPGTAMVYALLYLLFGQSFTPIVIMNVLLGVWIVAAAMGLAEKWFGPNVGVLTGWVLALWPNLIEFTTLLASELWFISLVLAALILWQFMPRAWWRRAAALGVVFAMAAYIRTIGLILPIPFLLLEWSVTGSRRYSIQTLLVSVTIMLALIAPWSIRNMQEFGQFVLLSTDGGSVMSQGILHNPFFEPEREPARPPGLNEAQFDRYATALMLDVIRADPVHFGSSILTRFLFMHSRESIGVVWNMHGLTARFGEGILLPLKAVNAVYWFAVLGAGVAGMVWLVRGKGWRAALLNPAIVMEGCLVLPLAVIVSNDRFHIPGAPFIAMLAAYGLMATSRAYSRKSNDPIRKEHP